MKRNLPTQELITRLQSVTQPPCLSLYMPTHQSHPENSQDPIRFKNLINELRESLMQGYPEKEVDTLLDPYESLLSDRFFWNHTNAGIAIFGANGFFETVHLQMPIKELVVVANSFHTKPLRHFLQSTDRYHVLGLTLDSVRIFEGNRHSLIEVVLPSHFPKTMAEALGEELTEKHSTVAAYGGVGGASTNMHHGHGGKKDEVENDAERFFRVVADAVYDTYSKPTDLPLILAALPEHHSVFHQVSKNPLLQKQGIRIDPQAVSVDKLTTMAWDSITPTYTLKIEQLTNQFKQVEANGKGSDMLQEIVHAAASGRVDTVLIEENKIIAGKTLNSTTETIETNDLDNPAINDLLDDLGELVIKQGGKVIILPLEYMPTNTGVAAIYRY